MSAHMKKPHTENAVVEVTIHGKTESKFIIPQAISLKISKLLAPYEITDDEELIPASEVFKHIDEKYGAIGANIRGYRYRDGMTQIELAKKLGISKNAVYNMEYSRLKVDKKMAQKLAQIFRTTPKMFI